MDGMIIFVKIFHVLQLLKLLVLIMIVKFMLLIAQLIKMVLDVWIYRHFVNNI